jgi:hypothetical protein
VLACTPQHDLGAVRYVRATLVHVVDASSCRDRVLGRNRPLPTRLAGVRIRSSRAAQTLVVDGRPIFRETQRYRTIGPGDTPGPIVLLGRSRRWIFFTIDPGGSASIAADGLVLRVIAARGGRVHELGAMLPYPDYLAWCGGRLVFSGGGDRLATSGKRLLVAGPPGWRPRPLVADRHRAWGSLACTPDGRAVVVQTQRESDDPSFFAARWSLWRIGLDGGEREVTSPPAGFADESPRYDGRTLLYVRSRGGHGVLLPLGVPLGFDSGYYGHHAWRFTPRPRR